jgi:alkylated DNA nucleotide flippase Atl1
LSPTAIEKIYTDHDLPKVKRAPEVWGGGMMVIPHPREVLEIMKTVPYGKLMTLDEIRQVLANDHQSDIACPMTTKAHAELSVVVAYWRTLKKNGELNPKFPGGLEDHQKRLETEGHRIIARRDKLFVENFWNALHRLR